jgi:thiosulfate/3-mercaptopyruvate sulfurtransferase
MTALAPDALVDAARLHGWLGRPDLVVFDSTTDIVVDATGHEVIAPARAAFQAGHIPGARFLDLQADLSEPDAPHPFTAPSARSLQSALRRLGVHQGDTIVVYSSGNPWWATRVWWLLRGHGMARVHVLDGGLATWKRAGLPVETGDAQPWEAGDAALGTARPALVEADALHARLGDPALRLVNALSPDKFDGRTPVHGGRPGHIPGSVNVPAASLLDPATGQLLPREALRARLGAAGLLEPGTDVVAYCGGGISATLVLLALAQAGRADARLYDASLYEWAHRADLPMATAAASPATQAP